MAHERHVIATALGVEVMISNSSLSCRQVRDDSRLPNETVEEVCLRFLRPISGVYLFPIPR